MPGVEARHLLAVAVERQRRPALGQQSALADAPFGRLAPARMIDLRVDVGIEAVLAGVLLLPGDRRLLVGEADAHDRLDALEAVLPRHHQPDRRAVLVGQRLAVEADGQDGERMHGLVEPQALDVGPGQRLEQAALARHLRRPHQRFERDVLGAALRLDALEHLGRAGSRPRGSPSTSPPRSACGRCAPPASRA